MGVVNYEMEVATGIPQAPAKMFQAFVLNSDNLIPKILPQAIKNIILTPALDHDCSVNMGVTCFNQEFTTPVAPAKMFNGLILDSQKPFPKLVPQSMKSIKFIEGDGGAGI